MKGPKTEEERSDTKGPRTQENETNFRCPEVRLGPLPPGPLDNSNFGDGYSKHLKKLQEHGGIPVFPERQLGSRRVILKPSVSRGPFRIFPNGPLDTSDVVVSSRNLRCPEVRLGFP